MRCMTSRVVYANSKVEFGLVLRHNATCGAAEHTKVVTSRQVDYIVSTEHEQATVQIGSG